MKKERLYKVIYIITKLILLFAISGIACKYYNLSDWRLYVFWVLLGLYEGCCTMYALHEQKYDFIKNAYYKDTRVCIAASNQSIQLLKNVNIGTYFSLIKDKDKFNKSTIEFYKLNDIDKYIVLAQGNEYCYVYNVTQKREEKINANTCVVCFNCNHIFYPQYIKESK